MPGLNDQTFTGSYGGDVGLTMFIGLTPPPTFYSANIDGGDAKNRELLEKYQDRIHYRM